MNAKIGFTVLVQLGFFVNIVNSNLPEYFPVCLRSDPKIAECVVRSVKLLQPRFPSGDLGSGFRIPKTEPFYIKRLQYGKPNVGRVILTDCYLRGLSNFQINSLNVNINDLKFEFILTFPQIEASSNYQVTLLNFGVPMHSTGKGYASYFPTRVHVILNGRKYLRNGVEYIQFDPIYFRFLQHTIKDIQFTNLFNENPFLGRILYSYVLYNKDYLASYVNPDIERTFSEIFTYVANLIASQASFDELFPR